MPSVPAPTPTHEPVNILLVDDQPAKLLSYQVILEELGEVLLTASSGREALATLLKNDVAIVLIDVQMPDLDGFELATMIREHPRFQQTALIFVSAIHLSDLDRIRGYQAGAVDYVPVPVVSEVLRAKVRVFAELHRKTRELERLNVELEQRVAERTAALEESAQALRYLNEDLERRIDLRTREREQALAQLLEAQKMETIGHLTGGVAHDFNNLLMAMLGSLELLKKRVPDDPSVRRLIDNAIKGVDRGAALTQRLLAFARRQELRPATVEIPALVAGMNELLGRVIGTDVTIIEDMAPGLPPVLIDENQLELALLNLAVNARDAMPDGGVITFSAAAVSAADAHAPPGLQPGGYVRLTVADNGIGMDQDVLSRAIEPFYTTKGVGKGTGLGLSMVHGLAAQSGGALALSSRPGEGTRIDLWLPESERQADVAIPAIGPQVDVSAVTVAPRTVLVVDDDVLVCAGTAAMLEDLGHTVLEAHSGAEALALLQSGRQIDLLITDQLMPKMTGTELIQIVRERWSDLCVILATGYAEQPVGVSPVSNLPRLAKPFRQEELERMIYLCTVAVPVQVLHNS
ncbi:MAG: response regulator [Acetobacteraceae bacterium]|jgi:signal transduction histidine kinase